MKFKLTRRELDVLNILWESSKPITAKEIVELNPSLSINTVQAVLKHLLKKEYIKVGDIVYSGTVLARGYSAVLDVNEYMAEQLMQGISSKRLSVEGIMAALLRYDQNDEKTIEKLEELLKQHRDRIRKG